MKHRQYTYTNKPLAINEGKDQWTVKAIIAILFLLLINNILLRAEGTSSIAPATADEAALFIGAGNTGSTGGDYGEFAWKGSNSKLSFNIQNTCERVYMGFSTPKRTRTFSSANISDIDYSLIFRIIDPQGNPINDLSCFGNKMIEGEVWQTLGEADINLSSRATTDLGPANLRSGGYIPFELDLSACGLTLTGNYSIEFFTQRVNYNPNRRTSGFYIEYFDVTVANCVNQEVKGRLWSNNWGFAVKNDGDGPFDRAFNGAFYICSKEGFISKINFNTGTNNRAEAGKNNDQQSGFRAGAFNVSLNTMGPNKSGHIQTDRQSVWAANSTNPELAVFLNLPDPAFCPPQAIGAFRAKNKFLSGCPGDYCINLAFSKPGQVELLIEAINGNRKFDDPVEVRLVREVVEADRTSSPEDANYPYEICVPWSGRDGAGNFVDFSKIFISGFYFQGIYHFPVYDAEFNDDGFTVETVRPALGLQELFYDDQQILADNLTGESKDGTNGCDAPCHRWTGEYVASADQTQIFGNFNTINTWWFANSTFKDFSLQPGLRPAIICPPDYTGCPGDDINPNIIGNATVSTSNPECTVINYEDRVLSQGTDCNNSLVIERKWSVYLIGLENDKLECVQRITLEDKFAPTLVGIPADETVRCDAIPAVATTISANDACNSLVDLIIAFKEEIITGNCAGNYQIKRSWTTTDQCGNSSTATQTIRVTDDTAPLLLNVPQNITVSCDAIPAVSTIVSATDNCETSESINIAFEEKITAGECAGNYMITRSWIATDACGNRNLAEQIITVVDNSVPILINIPADETVVCDAIPAVSNTVSATDNCEASEAINIAFNETLTAGSCTGNYTITRSWTATDNCGNTSTATQTLTVIDIVAPVLANIPADETVACNAIPAVSNAVSATDNCEPTEAINIAFEETITAGVCPGNYTITRSWTATDACGNAQVAAQTITVVDDSAPVLSNIPADETVACNAIPAVSNTVSATDNCEISESINITFNETLTAGSCTGNNTITRSWTATDNCGNISTATQTLTVIDTVAPVLANIPADETVACDAIPAVSNAVSATDNCESTEAINIAFEETITAGVCPGNYTITRSWTATDACGNQSESTQVITVVDNTAPTLFDVPADTTVNCHELPSIPENIMATDNCSADTSILISLEEEQMEGNCSGHFSLKRTWTATDACGNQTSQSQVLTVIDTIAPILSGIPDDITVFCEAVPVSAAVTAMDNCEATDNISVVFKELRLNGNCEGNYILKRAWTATDKCGNISFGEQMIIVKDTTAPIFVTCPSDTTLLAADDCNSAVLTIPIPEVTDNCNSDIRVISSVDLTKPFPMGTTVVIFTAIDDCGNTNTCEFLVTVKNAPQDHCPTNIRVTADNCDNTVQTAIVSWEPPTGNECCSACPQNTDLEGFIFLGARGGHRYYYAKNELNWLSASRLSDDLGGYLATINDPAENDFLNNLLVGNTAYIGLSDQGSLGEFYWQNEDDLNYTNWIDNEANIDPEETQVAQLSPDGRWQKTDGTKAARFLLEMPCMDVIQLTGPLNGSVFPLGTTTIDYLIDYDNCANADTCSFEVTVDSCQIVTNLGQYCSSTAADTTCFWIEKVIVEQTENESGNNGGYGDFTNSLTPLFKGLEQTLVLNPGYATGHTFNVYWKVWIDFNQDGIFDVTELIFTTKEYRPVAVNFTIPATAKLGHTRMRIALNFVDEDDPCSLLAFGEVEDYLVNISETSPGLISQEIASESRHTTSFKITDDGKYPEPILGLTPMEVVAARQTQLVVFPNPATKKLTVQIEGANSWLNTDHQQNYDLFIYNQIGQVVKQEKLRASGLNNTRIDVSNLSNGIYFIQVQLGATKTLKQKFLKMEN